jgi:hypothetical protein
VWACFSRNSRWVIWLCQLKETDRQIRNYVWNRLRLLPQPFFVLASAAVVTAAAAATAESATAAAAAQDKNKDDDPNTIVATESEIVAHK